MENNRSKVKAARYAVVYNRLLQMIQDGMYPEGSKLLSEPILAEEMNVSRSTLRQALALLQEDGFIEARRGVGNFVRARADAGASGLEKMDIPIYKSCREAVVCKRIEILTGISTQYTERIFKRKMPVVLAAHRYYKKDGLIQAYCFSHIASDYECLNQLDLNDEQAFLNFMECRIYQEAHSKKCEVKVVKMTENLLDKHIQNEFGYFQMIRESVVGVGGEVVAVNKFYIPIENAIIKVFSIN